MAPTLEPLGPHVVKDFGRSVAIRGSYAVVGDPADFDTFPGGGAAYVFKKSGGRWWMAGSKLVEPAPKLFDWFGQSVAISATHVIVGAPEATDAESHQGVAYLHQLPLDLGDFSDQYVMFATILFGLISGGGGVIIRPGSGPVPVDPEPFRTWMSLPASKQDMLVGLALGEIASLIHDEGTKERVKRAGLDLTKKAAARLAAPDRAQPKGRG